MTETLPLFDDEPAQGPRDWTPTRAEGLARLAAFQPAMGSRYRSQRNHDWGPDQRPNVSLLSPYIRRRLVTEREAVAAALDAHAASTAEKFVQEVFWRGYFKGWLEMRPSVWRRYRSGVEADRAALAENRALAKRVAAAEDGRTGIDCFDAWASELVETGYLHNHARMWFASIWIFTLGLPWRLGADFFLRHLLDGDPASNTLGWRWVAGLHTRGKNYVARASNIAKFTGGRFEPPRGALDEDAAPLEEEEPNPSPAPVPSADRPTPGARLALLITGEDCQPETLGLPLDAMTGAATARAGADRSDAQVSPAVEAFEQEALIDAADRSQAAGAPRAEPLDAATPEALAAWARGVGASEIVTAWAPVGPMRDRLDAARPALERAGVRLVMIRRDWDDAIWPHATAGFFKVKQKIPKLLDRLL